MPVGNIPGWDQVYSYDFPTDVRLGGFSGCVNSRSLLHRYCTGLPAAVNRSLSVIPDGGLDGSGHGQFWPSKVLSIENGILNINLHTQDGIHMGASIEPKIPGSGPKGGLIGGRFVVRFRADPLYGYKTVWELWPISGNAIDDGNISFPGGDLDSSILAYVLWADGSGRFTLFRTGVPHTSWHTCAIDWEPQKDRILYCLDGSLVGEATEGVPTLPMFWGFKTQTAEDGTIPTDGEHGNVQIAWMTAYVSSS